MRSLGALAMGAARVAVSVVVSVVPGGWVAVSPGDPGDLGCGKLEFPKHFIVSTPIGIP